MTDLNTHSGAVITDDHKFRYALWRKWKLYGNNIMFIGLNPSRANETYNDPTITRLINFSKDWGYDGMYMANLFAWRTPDPSFLKSNMIEFYTGEKTDEWLRLMAADSRRIVFCWGSWKNIETRSKVVEHEFPGSWCFGRNNNGAPKHPLYLKRSSQLIEYK